MYSERHDLQRPHLDYNKDDIKQHKIHLALMPLTDVGSWLELWPLDIYNESKVKGRVILIKYGEVFVFPGNMIHAGGFRLKDNDCPCMQFSFGYKTLPLSNTQMITNCRGKDLAEYCIHYDN